MEFSPKLARVWTQTKAALAGVATRIHRKLASYVASKGAAKAEMGNESVWRRGVSVPNKPFPHIPKGEGPPALTPPPGTPTPAAKRGGAAAAASAP